jgi:dGTPase
VRDGLPGRQLSLEAQIMDFSDDVAYSVHDFEDAVVNGYVDPQRLAGPRHRDEVLHSMHQRGTGTDTDAMAAAWDRLSGVPGWVTDFDATRAGLALLKNLTSTLIGRFAESSSVTGDGHVLSVPADTGSEIAVLKGIVSHHVMSDTARQPIYLEQRGQLSALATRLYNNPSDLDPVFALDWAQATTAQAKARVIVDQVASLTDQSAMVLHERLCS